MKRLPLCLLMLLVGAAVDRLVVENLNRRHRPPVDPTPTDADAIVVTRPDPSGHNGRTSHRLKVLPPRTGSADRQPTEVWIVTFADGDRWKTVHAAEEK